MMNKKKTQTITNNGCLGAETKGLLEQDCGSCRTTSGIRGVVDAFPLLMEVKAVPLKFENFEVKNNNFELKGTV